MVEGPVAPASDETEPAGSLVALAETLSGQGLVDDALAKVQAALDQRPDDPKLLLRAASVAEACGSPDVGARCWMALSEMQPWQPKWRSRLAMTAEQQADYAAAYQMVREALEVWPNDPTLRGLALSYGSMSGRSNSVEIDALALAQDETMGLKMRLHAVRYLIGQGMTSAVRPMLLALMEQQEEPDTAYAAACELKSVEILEEAGGAVACAVPGYLGMGRPAVFHRTEGADSTAIVFMGLAGKVGVAVNVFHAMLAPIKVNIVYLFDEDRVTHLNGNRAFGHDYQETVDRLRDMLEAWGTRRLVCIGHSSGGSAAIRYGLDLGAERIVSFGGATTLDPQTIWNEGRARSVINRMKRLAPHMLTDLRPLLERAAPAPRVDLYFGAGMDSDRRYAEHLSGLPTVRLHPFEGSDRHAVMHELLLHSDLKAIFAEVMEERPSSPSFPPTAHLFEYLLPQW